MESNATPLTPGQLETKLFRMLFPEDENMPKTVLTICETQQKFIIVGEPARATIVKLVTPTPNAEGK